MCDVTIIFIASLYFGSNKKTFEQVCCLVMIFVKFLAWAVNL